MSTSSTLLKPAAWHVVYHYMKHHQVWKRAVLSGVAVVTFATATVSNSSAKIVEYDRGIVTSTIKANDAKTRYCYERQLLVNPNLTGIVTAEFTSPLAAMMVKASTASGVDPSVAACVADVISKLRFRRQDSARETIRFSYPFFFRAT
jgi:hypothetical protein